MPGFYCITNIQKIFQYRELYIACDKEQRQRITDLNYLR